MSNNVALSVESRPVRYLWDVTGQPDIKSVLVVEDGRHFWKVVSLFTGEALMTALNTRQCANFWAECKGYKVMKPC